MEMWEHSPTCKKSNSPSRSFLPSLPSGSSPKVSGEWAGLGGLGTRRREAGGERTGGATQRPHAHPPGFRRGPEGS